MVEKYLSSQFLKCNGDFFWIYNVVDFSLWSSYYISRIVPSQIWLVQEVVIFLNINKFVCKIKKKITIFTTTIIINSSTN